MSNSHNSFGGLPWLNLPLPDWYDTILHESACVSMPHVLLETNRNQGMHHANPAVRSPRSLNYVYPVGGKLSRYFVGFQWTKCDRGVALHVQLNVPSALRRDSELGIIVASGCTSSLQLHLFPSNFGFLFPFTSFSLKFIIMEITDTRPPGDLKTIIELVARRESPMRA